MRVEIVRGGDPPNNWAIYDRDMPVTEEFDYGLIAFGFESRAGAIACAVEGGWLFNSPPVIDCRVNPLLLLSRRGLSER